MYTKVIECLSLLLGRLTFTEIIFVIVMRSSQFLCKELAEFISVALALWLMQFIVTEKTKCCKSHKFRGCSIYYIKILLCDSFTFCNFQEKKGKKLLKVRYQFSYDSGINPTKFSFSPLLWKVSQFFFAVRRVYFILQACLAKAKTK